MSELAIRAQGIGKEYVLGGTTEPYQTIRTALINAAKAPLRLFSFAAAKQTKTFWAVKDISFDVGRGETVGIIGRNGAGKSTLLKILSRITEPSTGRAEVHGRMSSLLEVGTGFHPELTGRENILLNGAILGMKRAEILAKFDEIVAFAEVERFVDTAVKHYSSGMYLRLAFAVAAHLQPEILVVDEVLAVGDASFQKKCLGKMADVASHGRTVLFVSHNMQAVTRLCSRAILLDAGTVIEDGPTSRVVGAYLRGGFGTTAQRQWDDVTRAPGNDIARLRSVRVIDEQMVTRDAMTITRPVGIEMVYEVLRGGHHLVPNLQFHNDEGICLFVALDGEEDRRDEPRAPGVYRAVAWAPPNLFSEGGVVVGAALSSFDPLVIHFHERDAVAFQIVEPSNDEGGVRHRYAGAMPGVLRPRLSWETREHVGAP